MDGFYRVEPVKSRERKMHGNMPVRGIFWNDEKLDTPGWRLAGAW